MISVNHTHTHIHTLGTLILILLWLQIMFSCCWMCVSPFISASLWQIDRVKAEETKKKENNDKEGRWLRRLQLQSTTMMRCIYFQHWDLAPHNTGLKGSRLKIVILLDFNKCYMVIFIKIDFLPLKTVCRTLFMSQKF